MVGEPKLAAAAPKAGTRDRVLERSGPAPSKPVKSRVIQRQSYYVISDSPEERVDLIGIHYGRWPDLEQLLPGGQLAGSRARDCKRFDEWADAVQYYCSRMG